LDKDIHSYIEKAVELKASDIHVTVGIPPVFRIRGELLPYGNDKLMAEDTEKFIMDIMTDTQKETLKNLGEVDFSYAIPGVSRFRVNAFKQRNSYSVAIRILLPTVPDLSTLGVTPLAETLALRPRGLVLVTGPTGSGKSTTLAAMVSIINKTKSCHILTIEDPIEYLHKHGRSMINQREIGDDTKSFANAMRAALREDPDVILVGEMRDLETIATAITASETGHLVLSTLHTTSAAQTIDRIIDVFPPHQQQQIRVQLSSVLQGIISQQLIPSLCGTGRALVQEVLISNDAIRNLIREGKTHNIDTVLQTNIKTGMMPLDYSLAQLVKDKKISGADAASRASDLEMLKRYIND